MINGNGHYSVMGIYYPLDASDQYVQDEKSLMLPAMKHRVDDSSVAAHGTSSSGSASDQTVSMKRS